MLSVEMCIRDREGDPIRVSDLKEGEVSALSGKIRKIQEMQEMSVSQAEEEKEQVKSLISNMSHQLKTPLANIRMYEEILREENQDAETREKFLAKMQTQSEKLEWILNSLFKICLLYTSDRSECDAWKRRDHAHRSAWRCDERISTDRNQLYPFCQQRLSDCG